MARIDSLTNFLTDIATSIRNKKGTTEQIPAQNFDAEIESITSGGIDTSDATATAKDIRKGTVAYTANGKEDGTLTFSNFEEYPRCLSLANSILGIDDSGCRAEYQINPNEIVEGSKDVVFGVRIKANSSNTFIGFISFKPLDISELVTSEGRPNPNLNFQEYLKIESHGDEFVVNTPKDSQIDYENHTIVYTVSPTRPLTYIGTHTFYVYCLDEENKKKILTINITVNKDMSQEIK